MTSHEPLVEAVSSECCDRGNPETLKNCSDNMVRKFKVQTCVIYTSLNKNSSERM